MALTESEMDRIKKEEIYRNEVRSNLEKEGKPSTRLEKSWGFVNSPFMLWVLSTVIVGLVSFGYTRYQERMKKEQENRQTAQKLRAEIDNRSKEILRLTAQITDEARTTYYDPRWIYKTAVNFMDGEKDSSLTAYQPVLEFKEKNWKTLVGDLEKAAGSEASASAALKNKYETLKMLWKQTPAQVKNTKPTDDESKRAVDAATQVSNIINSQ
jgi:phosphate/sulfate permease